MYIHSYILHADSHAETLEPKPSAHIERERVIYKNQSCLIQYLLNSSEPKQVRIKQAK